MIIEKKRDDGLISEWINKPLNEIINKIIFYINNLYLFENINNENNCKWILKCGSSKGLNCKQEVIDNGFCKIHSLKINKLDPVCLKINEEENELNFNSSNIDFSKINKLDSVNELDYDYSNIDYLKINK